MQSKKKFWQILLAVALAILTTVAFTGCSSSDKKPEAGAASADDSLSKIKAKGKLPRLNSTR